YLYEQLFYKQEHLFVVEEIAEFTCMLLKDLYQQRVEFPISCSDVSEHMDILLKKWRADKNGVRFQLQDHRMIMTFSLSLAQYCLMAFAHSNNLPGINKILDLGISPD